MRRLSAPSRHLPFAVDLADFDDGAAMRGHFDVDARLVRRRHLQLALRDADDAGEHEVLIGVFVIHHQQAMRGRAAERDEPDIVVIVAELPALGLGGLVLRVEGGGAREKRVAPAQQHLGVIAFGDMMGLVDAGLDLHEAEGRAIGGGAIRGGLRLLGGQQRRRADGGGDGGNGQRTFQEPATGEADRDQLTHGRVERRVTARAVSLFEKAGAEGGFVYGVEGVVGHGGLRQSVPLRVGSVPDS